MLREGTNCSYLCHNSEAGEFSVGSDAITHSYKTQIRKQWLIRQIPDDAEELYQAGLTIGAYIIFSNNMVDGKHTINQARGVNKYIDDRFDLTLECIRRFFLKIESPLYETLIRYQEFFNLFNDFHGYIHFFMLEDLVDTQGDIRFYLPFDDFHSTPSFSNVDDYLKYKNKVMNFIASRNKRIAEYTEAHFQYGL